MINHVLVPLDGSQLAEKALPAVRQVIRSGGQITLLTAVQHPTPPIPAIPDVSHEAKEDFSYVQSAMPRAREYLENVAKNLRLQGYHVSVEVAGGEPADAIIRLSEKLRVEMIVMSTHGRSGLSRFLFGSITLKVLEAALVPVLVVPNRERVEVQEPEIPLETGINPAT
ncbi:MAG: universal stress protein [Anaerolineae bacterium]|nr:universal stress protein [Anaerolineae bacterium]